MSSIEFITLVDLPINLHPMPAKFNLPAWYKESDTYSSESTLTETNSTIKKCMPVFDAMSAGYLLLTDCDIEIKNEGSRKLYRTISSDPNRIAVVMHHKWQTSNYPYADSDVPKYINPWIIKTKPGYSTIFLPPIHSDKQPISIMEGIVDTDNFPMQISLPFKIDQSFEGIIKAGTPIAQMIPFKREKWESRVVYDPKYAKIMIDQMSQTAAISVNKYKKLYRSEKDYS